MGETEIMDSEDSRRNMTDNWALVAGFGNPLMGDDGVGIKVVAALKDYDLPQGVDLVDAGTSALDLVPLLDGKKFVVLIDAVSGNNSPGTVYKLSAQDLYSDSNPVISLHSLSLADAVKLWDLQLVHLPEIVVFGIEPKCIELGMELSPELEELIPRLCRLIRDELMSK